MSAFLVSFPHVDAILSAVERCRFRWVEMPDGTRLEWASTGDFTVIGKELLAENIRSLRAAYPNSWREMVNVDVNAYRFVRDDAFAAASAIAAVKLCNCLEYQSCEDDGWDSSYARRFLDFARRVIILSSPEYDAAPWDYPGNAMEPVHV